MDDAFGLVFLTLIVLTSLVLWIVGLAKLSALKATVDQLKKRVGDIEAGGASPVPKPAAAKAAVPPPLPTYVTKPQTATAPPTTRASVPVEPHHAFNWESILGVKLFAWIGGFAFFLGIVFFVKYSFERNWVTPSMRITTGAIIGVVLIAISLLPRVRRY